MGKWVQARFEVAAILMAGMLFGLLVANCDRISFGYNVDGAQITPEALKPDVVKAGGPGTPTPTPTCVGATQEEAPWCFGPSDTTTPTPTQPVSVVITPEPTPEGIECENKNGRRECTRKEGEPPLTTATPTPVVESTGDAYLKITTSESSYPDGTSAHKVTQHEQRVGAGATPIPTPTPTPTPVTAETIRDHIDEQTIEACKHTYSAAKQAECEALVSLRDGIPEG